MNIVVPTAYLKDVRDWVLSTREVETHAFLFGAFSHNTIRIGKLWKTPPDMYEERSTVSVVLKQEYVIKALEYAKGNNFAIIDVHSHPFSRHAQFSATDDAYGLENARWIRQKAKQHLFPQLPWGMIVIAGSGELTARIFDTETNAFREATVRSPLDFGEGEPQANDPLFDRQIRLWGTEGQRKIAQVRVAIVGVGGLGSLVCEQLARIGIRQFTLIDGDKVEITNLNRLTGFYPEHVGLFKVDVAAENIKRLAGNQARVEAVHRFHRREDLHLLAGHDLLVGTVDSEGARVLLNEASLRYLIPCLDLGTGITVDKETVIRMGGQIRWINPGTTPCLQCYGNGIDALEAALDLMPAQDRQIRRQLGYIEGTNLSPEPSVIPLNGILAALAAQEISRLITGFHRTSIFLSYDALTDQIKILEREKALIPQKACPACGVGGYLGLGDLKQQSYVTNEEQEELKILFS